MIMSSINEEISLISEGLYTIMSDLVGSESIVKLRRQGLDTYDAIQNCDSIQFLRKVTSGSRSEGMTLRTSDIDTMFMDKTVLVLKSSPFKTNEGMTNMNVSAILVMETDNVTPGFSLLKCLTCDYKNGILFNSLVWRGSNVYVSSEMIRESFRVSSSVPHGPCQSLHIYQNCVEQDLAYTLKCPFWPDKAENFIKRSINLGWPSCDVLKEICNDGCLFVPISSKQQYYSDLVDMEWRISFSLAEKKLVYSMNHCQFLCYGLSKLFLNEILNTIPPINDLLCSYFMKTAVFWEISEAPFDWSIQNFLSKFWNVFRRIMKWVSVGYCPNFFIPENNMFYGKICGENQGLLLSILRELYADGYWGLLRCSSLKEDFTMIITEPYLSPLLSSENDEIASFEIEKGRLEVAFKFNFVIIVTAKTIAKTLSNTIKLNAESEEIKCAVRLRLNHILQSYADISLISTRAIHHTYPRNKKQYKNLTKAKIISLRTKTFLCINYLNYAKCMYRIGNYHKSLQLLHYIRRKLQSQFYMFGWNLDYDITLSIRQHGITFDNLIKSFIISHVKIDIPSSIEELELECHATFSQTGASSLLIIPPLVFIDFLLILNYTRLGDNQRKQDILDELFTLLYHDDGSAIPIIDRAISWEILGICQQLCHDNRGAFQSYKHALDDEFNIFKPATLIRIESLNNRNIESPGIL